jgi:hypothetical protein
VSQNSCKTAAVAKGIRQKVRGKKERRKMGTREKMKKYVDKRREYRKQISLA